MANSRSFLHRVIPRIVAAGVIVLASVASAQGPASTGLASIGSPDPSWQVSTNGGGFTTAFVISRSPSVPGSYQWIWGTTGCCLPGGAADGNFTRDLYSFRTSFTGDGLLSVSYRCAYDDAMSAILLNGTTVTGACGAYNLGATQTLTGFTSGMNTLQFDVSGNGVTDGFVLEVEGVEQAPVSSVPEPASVALVGLGLAALGIVARRRRS